MELDVKEEYQSLHQAFLLFQPAASMQSSCRLMTLVRPSAKLTDFSQQRGRVTEFHHYFAVLFCTTF